MVGISRMTSDFRVDSVARIVGSSTSVGFKMCIRDSVGDVYTDRRAIFDVYCEGENGEKFIVEMQNAYQTYFKDRALFYSTCLLYTSYNMLDEQAWTQYIKLDDPVIKKTLDVFENHAAFPKKPEPAKKRAAKKE